MLSIRHGSRGSSRREEGLLEWDEKFGPRRWQLQAHRSTLTEDSHTEATQIRLAKSVAMPSEIIPEEDDARECTIWVSESRMATAEQVESWIIRV
jgi:hypothetical protein